jgi:hypothetical protein
MANTFYRKQSANVGTTSTTVGSYTVSSTATTICVGLSISNTTGSAVNASLFINNGANNYYIVKNAPIASGGTLIPVGGDQKVVLQFNDNVKVVSDTATSLDVYMSIMEIT